MADAQIGGINGFTSANIGTGAGNKSNLNGANTDAQTGLDMDNLDTIAAMRARLTTINGTLYTVNMLNTMTVNDMQYAIRVNDFASTIKQ